MLGALVDAITLFTHGGFLVIIAVWRVRLDIQISNIQEKGKELTTECWLEQFTADQVLT